MANTSPDPDATSDSAAPASLTQEEARQRAAILTVDRYDIALDLTGLLTGETLTSTSTVTFSASAGADTFADCVADVSAATLNGEPLDLTTISRGRIPLTGLREHNTLVVTASQSNTATAEGVLRTVDPTDEQVYVWTSFEPDDARRVWACFDQPDLKAVHAFTVTAPAAWTVLSNTGPTQAPEAAGADARTWVFEDTPRLSTYVVVVNAGPFAEMRAERGGYDLGLYARQSLQAQLERDAEEIWDITEHGLAWYGERFGLPFPQTRYDQVFVPGMGGAMENWGCITHTDSMLYRGVPTMPERTWRTNVVLHEMAHMWFGDLVTMRWWDDLWLNEAFASWAAVWCSSNLPGFAEAWAAIALTEKIPAYVTDLSPATHPIRGVVASVDEATANFDAITYAKGQSVLQQLHAYLGEEAYLDGLKAYFAEHAYGNTVLDDLMGAFGRAAGKDLSGWTTAWLDHARPDTITLEAGKLAVTSPDDAVRPHHLEIGSYAADGSLLASTPVTIEAGAATVELPEADAHLVNATDVTYAIVRSDGASEAWLGDHAGLLPDASARAVAVTSAWLGLLEGHLSGPAFVSRAVAVLEHERSPMLVGPILDLAESAAERWTAPDSVAAQRALLAEACEQLLDTGAVRVDALRLLARHATTEAQIDLAEQAAADDVTTGWMLLRRRAELGSYDQASADVLLARDPDPEAWVSALAARAAGADPEAKAEAWQVAMVDRRLPHSDAAYTLPSAFWRPGQEALLAPYAQHYLDAVTAMGGGGMLNVMLPLRFYPALAGADFTETALAASTGAGVPALVRQSLLRLIDTHSRQLTARSM